MRSIINSRKHLVQTTLSEAAANSIIATVLVDAKQNPDQDIAVEVEPGAVVKAIFVEYWVLGGGQQPSTMTYLIEKVDATSAPVTNGFMSTLHTYPGKKQILEMHQGLVGDANANPIPVFRHWIKIPKGKQRFGLGDRLVLTIRSITEATQICGFAIFKSYT